MLDSRGAGAPGGGPDDAGQGYAPPPSDGRTTRPRPAAPGPAANTEADDFDDDIPF